MERVLWCSQADVHQMEGPLTGTRCRRRVVSILRTERVLWRSQADVHQMQVPLTKDEMQKACRFNGFGFFDAWILRLIGSAS